MAAEAGHNEAAPRATLLWNWMKLDGEWLGDQKTLVLTWFWHGFDMVLTWFWHGFTFKPCWWTGFCNSKTIWMVTKRPRQHYGAWDGFTLTRILGLQGFIGEGTGDQEELRNLSTNWMARASWFISQKETTVMPQADLKLNDKMTWASYLEGILT